MRWCIKIIGSADGNIIAIIITTHIANTASKLLADQAGDIGIVSIANGWQLSVINQKSISQQNSTPQSAIANNGIWFLIIINRR